MSKTVTVLSGLIRPLVENRLPDWVEPRFFASKEEALELAPQAEIGWFDMYDKKDMAAVITAATGLKWVNSIYAGVDGMPLDLLHERGTIVTNDHRGASTLDVQLKKGRAELRQARLARRFGGRDPSAWKLRCRGFRSRGPARAVLATGARPRPGGRPATRSGRNAGISSV